MQLLAPPDTFAVETASAVSTTSSIAINVPAGAEVGDLLVASFYAGDFPSLTAINVPSGWTEVGTDTNGTHASGYLWRHSLAYRWVDGTESSSYTWTKSGSDSAGTFSSGSITLVKANGYHVDPTNPVTKMGSPWVTAAANPHTYNAAASNHRSGGAVLLAHGHTRIATPNPASATVFTEQGDSNRMWVGSYDMGWTNATVPNFSITWNVSCEGIIAVAAINLLCPKVTDGSWTLCSHAYNYGPPGRNGVMLSDGTILVASLEHGGGNYNINAYKSTDGGRTFTKCTTPFVASASSTEHPVNFDLVQSSLDGGYLWFSVVNNSTNNVVSSTIRKWNFSGGDVSLPGHSVFLTQGSNYKAWRIQAMSDPAATYDELVGCVGAELSVSTQWAFFGYDAATGFSTALASGTGTTGPDSGITIASPSYMTDYKGVADSADLYWTGGDGLNVRTGKLIYSATHNWTLSESVGTTNNGGPLSGMGLWDSTNDLFYHAFIDANNNIFSVASVDDDTWPTWTWKDDGASTDFSSSWTRVFTSIADPIGRRIYVVAMRNTSSLGIYGDYYDVSGGAFFGTGYSTFLNYVGYAAIVGYTAFYPAIQCAYGDDEFYGAAWADANGINITALRTTETPPAAPTTASAWGLWGT